MHLRSRDVNGTDNFRIESASASVFKDVVCNYRNPPDMGEDMDIGHADIRWIWWRIWYCYYPAGADYPTFLANYPTFQNKIIQLNCLFWNFCLSALLNSLSRRAPICRVKPKIMRIKLAKFT